MIRSRLLIVHMPPTPAARPFGVPLGGFSLASSLFRRGVLPLRGQGAIQLADPARVADFDIDVDLLVGELSSQGLQDTRDQSAVVGGKVDPIEQVPAVPAVGDDRNGPAERLQERRDRERLLIGQFLLGVGRGDCPRSLGVAIDQQPATPNDVAVFGGPALPVRWEQVHQPGHAPGSPAQLRRIAGHAGQISRGIMPDDRRFVFEQDTHLNRRTGFDQNAL